MPRLSCFVPRAAWVMTAVFCVCAPAHAQEPITREAPAHISLVEGTAVLERDGQTDASPSSMPLLAGDRVRTRAGRVEILFADGSTLHLDANTVVDFQSDEVIRLLDGRIRVNIAGPDRPIAYRIDAPSGWVEVKEPGAYRVALVGGERGQEVELAVLRGAADLVNEDGATELRAGERSFAAAGAAPSQPYVFNSAAWDAFDRWS
jgi:ferric-dicitrate binding protein FerR (iron transport regulator)